MKKKAKKRAKPKPAPIVRIAPPPPKPWELNAQEVELVKQHICPGASDLELQFNLTVARRFKLDPFRQQIWFVPRKVNREKKWVPIVGINGLLHIAARDHADFGSISDPEYGPTLEIEWWKWKEVRGQWQKVEKHTLVVPEWARVRVTKKGMTEPTVATVYWEEIYPDIDFSPVVQRMPKHMLGKCAVAHAIRRAYPSTDGLYISEEFSGQRPDYTREGREIEYSEPVRYDDVQKEAIENLRSRGDWCDEHNCARSMKHLREYHFDEIGTKPEEFASSSTASKPTQSVPTGGQTLPGPQSPVQHAPRTEGGAPSSATTPNASPSAPLRELTEKERSFLARSQMRAPSSAPITDNAAAKLLDSAKKLIDKNLKGSQTHSKAEKQPSSLLKRFNGSPTEGSKPPQARIPVKVQTVKWTPSGAGLSVQLDTGKWLYCFDNKKMGEDREELFNILLTAPGKECIFLTKESKKKNSDQTYINITHLLQCGEREWGEDGVPVLRREPATKPQREPGDDAPEEWLK